MDADHAAAGDFTRMSFLDLIGSFLGGGGLTSAITGAVGAFTKYKELKLYYEHEGKKWDYEVKMFAAQAGHERYLVENKRLMVTETVAAATQQAAIHADASEAVALLRRQGNAPAWAVFRTLFRPGLTLSLFFACLLMPFMPMPAVAAGMVVNPHIAGIYSTIRQGFAAALGFWFGSRAVSNPNKSAGAI